MIELQAYAGTCSSRFLSEYFDTSANSLHKLAKDKTEWSETCEGYVWLWVLRAN